MFFTTDKNTRFKLPYTIKYDIIPVIKCMRTRIKPIQSIGFFKVLWHLWGSARGENHKIQRAWKDRTFYFSFPRKRDR